VSTLNAWPHGDLSTAVEAVRQGAFDYVAKPFDLDHIERVVERSLAAPATAVAPAAARKLGIHRTTLKKKRDQYGITDE
jgi:DNA-binding NtrC family response regulator